MWYYRGQGFDIALRYHYVSKRGRWQLANVGFLGDVEPRIPLEVVLEKSKEFLIEQGCSSLFAIRPKQMTNPGIEAFHRLVPEHPELKVTVEHETADRLMWNLDIRELADAKGESIPAAASG